jgi:CBS domain-containing protein
MNLLRARDLMRRDLVTVRPQTPLEELAEILDDEDVHGVPVVDGNGRVVGVVSRTDLARAVAEAETGRDDRGSRVVTVEGTEDWETVVRPEAVAALEGRVADIMSDRVVTARENDTAGSLAARMVREEVHRLLVVEGGRLVGMVSATDLLSCIPRYEETLRSTGATTLRAAPPKKKVSKGPRARAKRPGRSRRKVARRSR